jgi:hypothetical protein
MNFLQALLASPHIKGLEPIGHTRSSHYVSMFPDTPSVIMREWMCLRYVQEPSQVHSYTFGDIHLAFNSITRKMEPAEMIDPENIPVSRVLTSTLAPRRPVFKFCGTAHHEDVSSVESKHQCGLSPSGLLGYRPRRTIESVNVVLQ